MIENAETQWAALYILQIIAISTLKKNCEMKHCGFLSVVYSLGSFVKGSNTL